MLLAFIFVPALSSFAAVTLLKSFTEANVSGTSNFGASVSGAGDVNNDTYDDVIVGAYNYNSITGRAYIFYGGATMNNVADVTMTGEGTGNNFGASVSSAGDVNNDGYDDVIVGAFGYNSNTGRAYVYYGGSTMDNTADVTMTGQDYNQFFGSSVSSAGDVNGDSYDDLVIGAYGYNSGVGRAYIYHGGSAMDNAADLTVDGEAAGDTFGRSVSAAGDVNNDGAGDIIVGAPGHTLNTGRAYVYFGGSGMDSSADVTMSGDTTECYFGFSVSNAGDVDGDSYADVIIGACGNDTTSSNAYIFMGGASMDSLIDETLLGENVGSYFGYSVSDAGDLNDDNYADVIVGAYRIGSGVGRAYIYFGGVNMYGDTAAVAITGETAGNYLGRSVSSAGDVNNDGFADVIVGSFGYNSTTGRAEIYFGGAEVNIGADVTLNGETLNNYFGRLVSIAGDVNNDGFDDVIVGAPHYNSNTGRAYVYYGSSAMDSTADVILTGEGVANYFGVSVACAGDVNGDNYKDVIVGAYGIGSVTGRAYIYYGGAAMDNEVDVMLTGEGTGNYFGYYVSGAGDVNNDSFDDVITGAHGYNSFTGRAYVFFGGAAMNNTADLTMDGEATNNYYGFAVSGTGDINKDNYDDVIVGAYGNSSEAGRAYIYYGGATMDNTADVTISGALAGGSLGISVSCAGDVNNDTYADVIIGEEGYSAYTGRAHIYFGSTAMDVDADVTMVGEGAGNIFGRSVSNAGDVNNDGYADVIIGAPGYGNSTGRAYVYFGGLTMDGVADLAMTGETTNSNFGESVSSAGDVNDDGYDDVLIGAPNYLPNGKAYLYAESSPSSGTTYTKNLVAGWTWFSVNVKMDDMSLNTVLNSIAPNGVSIKDQTSFADYYEGFGWYSSNGLDVIRVTTGYKIYMSNTDILTFTGVPVDYANTQIDLVAGWNWIGYMPQVKDPINHALSSIEPNGTFIKNQTAYADYYAGFGWYSSNGLDSLVATEGYMLFMSSADTLIYPTPVKSTAAASGQLAKASHRAVIWQPDVNKYESSMAITGVVLVNGVEHHASDLLVGAFVDEECRGVAELVAFPLNGRFEFGMLVHGQDGEELIFKVYDRTSDNVLCADSKMKFAADARIGSGLAPFELSVKTNSAIAALELPEQYQLYQNYPNPFNPSTTIAYDLPQDGEMSLEIYDVRGRLVRTLQRGELAAGHYEIIWNGRNDLGIPVVSGIYFYKMKSGEYNQTRRMIFMK